MKYMVYNITPDEKGQSQENVGDLRNQTPMFATVDALALLAAGCGGDKKTDKNTPASTPIKKTFEATLPPREKYDAKYWNTVVCYKDKVTIKEGNTLFGITTRGLRKDETFTNRVFAFNLETVKKEAKTQKTLRDPDAIPIGTKFSIMTDCVKLGAPAPEYDINNISSTGDVDITGYTRDAEYQNFSGTDGVVRHLVTVRYHSNAEGDFYDPRTEEPFKPVACSPSPECYKYIQDPPKTIPKDVYLP